MAFKSKRATFVSSQLKFIYFEAHLKNKNKKKIKITLKKVEQQMKKNVYPCLMYRHLPLGIQS